VFEQANSQYRALVGGRELTGKSLHDALPELIGQPFHDLMKRVFATGEPFIAREMIARLVRHAGGEPEDVYFDFTYSRVTDGEGRPYGVYIHAIDITEKVLARRALEGAVQTLEQERDARERFVSTLTHDLRTPLTSAKLSAQMIARRPDDASAVQRQASRIVNHVDRIDVMIRDLLDANRIKAGERLPIEVVSADLSRIAVETLAELGTIHGDRFVLHAPPEFAGYWGAKEVRRILENLCTNAVKYGSSLHQVEVAIEPRGDNVAIRVHNEGPSIPAAEWPSLFEPFRRADTANTGGQKGWGLGLTLVRGLAEAHGGSARLDSSSESGTTFEVLLPRDARP
jgi:signal transduction histidine kinase